MLGKSTGGCKPVNLMVVAYSQYIYIYICINIYIYTVYIYIIYIYIYTHCVFIYIYIYIHYTDDMQLYAHDTCSFHPPCHAKWGPSPGPPYDIPILRQIAPGMEVSYVVRFKPDARRWWNSWSKGALEDEFP